MGEARRRGTFEHRQDMAIKRKPIIEALAREQVEEAMAKAKEETLAQRRQVIAPQKTVIHAWCKHFMDNWQHVT